MQNMVTVYGSEDALDFAAYRPAINSAPQSSLHGGLCARRIFSRNFHDDGERDLSFGLFLLFGCLKTLYEE